MHRGSMRSSSATYSTLARRNSLVARSVSPMPGLRAETAVSSGADGSSLRIAFELSKLRELRGLRELGPKPACAIVCRIPIVELTLDVVAKEQHRRRCRSHVEISLQERSRLQIVLVAVRKLHQAGERIREHRVTGQRLAKILLRALDVARIARTIARVRQRRRRRRITRVRDRAAEMRLGVLPAISPAEENRVSVRNRRVIGLESQCALVVLLGLVGVAELIVSERERAMRRRKARVDAQRPLQVVDGEVRPSL